MTERKFQLPEFMKTVPVKEQKEIHISPSGWFVTGRDRGLRGQTIMSDMIHTNFGGKATYEETVEYQYGYMSSVVAVLERNGVTTPRDLGIEASYMHVVVGSNAGVLGFRDGRLGKLPDEKSVVIDGEAGMKHFIDGYKIGFVYTRSLAREGNFAPLHNNNEITEVNKNAIAEDVGVWLKKKGIDVERYDPMIIVNLNSYVRDGFSYYLNNEHTQDLHSGFNKYLELKLHQMRTSNNDQKKRRSHEDLMNNLRLMAIGFERARHLVDIRDRRISVTGGVS